MKQVTTHLSAIIIAVATLSVAGCQPTDALDLIEVELRTDKEFYVADSSTTIILSVMNKSEDPVFFICTGQIYLEELDDGQVIGTWQVHGFEKCGGFFPIDADVTMIFDFQFYVVDEFGLEQFSLGQLEEASFSDSVRYRFRMNLFINTEFAQFLNEEDRLSNRISIVQE